VDERLGIDRTLPEGTPDLVGPKLFALREYQFSLAAPAPPAGSFDTAAATRGQAVFEGAGRCGTCHQGAGFSEERLHEPAETGTEPIYASRSATKKYRTSPLRGLWTHPPYFHDGSAATLEAVVEHYEKALGLGLSAAQKSDLVQYLKSL
jgi:mono/diheme cytochrome c family protein